MYEIVPNQNKDLFKCPKGMFMRKFINKNDIEAMENYVELNYGKNCRL